MTIEREREQLLTYWSRLFGEDGGKLNQNSAPLQRLFARKKSTSMDVRKVHDAFGWCAKKPKLCAGAIYRTEAFIAIEPSQRDPSKPRGVSKERWPRNIHIEHTVLASQLHRMWLDREPRGETDCTFFIANGVATAMHADEERALGTDYRTINPCFERGAEGLPFQRYRTLPKGAVIRNVYTGEAVDIQTYSLNDHRRTVRALLKEAKAPQHWIDSLTVDELPK